MSELITNVCAGKSIVSSVSTALLLTEPRSVVDREPLPPTKSRLSEHRQAFLREDKIVEKLRKKLALKERYVSWSQSLESV
jgi:hypothetical protein